MTDRHVHSVHSGDSPAPLREMCARAVEVGLSEITFTEHLDFTPSDVSYGAFVYERWIPEIKAAREEFSNRLTIHTGVEVDYQERFRSQIEDYLASHSFDYILGSVHYVDGVIMESHEDYFPGKNVRDAYLPYFEALVGAAQTGLFHTLGHLDLCKRYGVRYYGAFHLEPFADEVSAVLREVIARGMVIEINTSGLRQSPAETYPALDTLRLYKEIGGARVVLGSDSHKPEHLGVGFPEAGELAAKARLKVI